LKSIQKLAAETHRETHFLSHEEKKKWIQDYVERETAGARKRVEDAEAAMWHEQKDTEAAEKPE
jgi:predicted N-acyltransferase